MDFKIVLRYLLLKINNDEILVGQKMPSKGFLSYKFNCHKHTIEKIYRELIKNNYIQFKEGNGYFLINNLNSILNFSSITSYSNYKKIQLSEKGVPLKFLKYIDDNQILVRQMSKAFFLNDLLIGNQFVFIHKNFKDVIKVNFNSLFKQFSLQGIAINSIKKSLLFVNNKNSKIPIQDTNILFIKFMLFDENNNEVCQFYNLCSIAALQNKKIVL